MAFLAPFLKIEESADPQLADDPHSDCRKCMERDRCATTWTIRLLMRCAGGCGCIIQLDHVGLVHDSSGTGLWEGTYNHPVEIGDPALRRYAEALLATHVRPPHPPMPRAIG